MKFSASIPSFLLLAATRAGANTELHDGLRALQTCVLEDNNPLGSTYSNETVVFCVTDCGQQTMIDPSEDCAADEIRIEWPSSGSYVLGPQGPQGKYF